ncbi:hypothetical protein [Hymenobacter terrenus]|uniref:hypothetical protein n=1 Tax=Hymenobacter terrenus TaxID=1629124 RepID=UPI000AF06C43|nr:hypothetical protein [Hymenobacter terrenus]
MFNTAMAPSTPKSVYQRPYKSRNQRREADRRKYDEANDQKFLWRVAGTIGLLLMVAVVFAVKGMAN